MSFPLQYFDFLTVLLLSAAPIREGHGLMVRGATLGLKGCQFNSLDEQEWPCWSGYTQSIC